MLQNSQELIKLILLVKCIFKCFQVPWGLKSDMTWSHITSNAGKDHIYGKFGSLQKRSRKNIHLLCKTWTIRVPFRKQSFTVIQKYNSRSLDKLCSKTHFLQETNHMWSRSKSGGCCLGKECGKNKVYMKGNWESAV